MYSKIMCQNILFRGMKHKDTEQLRINFIGDTGPNWEFQAVKNRLNCPIHKKDKKPFAVGLICNGYHWDKPSVTYY